MFDALFHIASAGKKILYAIDPANNSKRNGFGYVIGLKAAIETAL